MAKRIYCEDCKGSSKGFVNEDRRLLCKYTGHLVQNLYTQRINLFSLCSERNNDGKCDLYKEKFWKKVFQKTGACIHANDNLKGKL